MMGKIESVCDPAFEDIGEMKPKPVENNIFKVLSILLQFPDQELLKHVLQLRNALKDFYNATARSACEDFLAYLESTPVLKLQETYTLTFDLSPETCLNLSYHKCGNSQERGHALVKLNQIYNSTGLEISGGYLPDYLPLMLEFRYQYPIVGKNQVLKPYSDEIQLLAQRLEAQHSPYAPLIGLVSHLSRELFGPAGD
jgi:nitrate reductase molybdenum cofactor assembly chaperone NarJ/NarW